MDMPSNLGVATSWNLGIKMTPFATGWISDELGCLVHARTNLNGSGKNRVILIEILLTGST
jgi:hypothetical protein